MMFFKDVALKQMKKKLSIMSRTIDEASTTDNIEPRKRNENGGTFMIRTLLSKEVRGKSL